MTKQLTTLLNVLAMEAERRREFDDAVEGEYVAEAALLEGFVDGARGEDDSDSALYSDDDLKDAYGDGQVAADVFAAMRGILEAMYPGGDPEAEWSPDTLNEIARVLKDHGLAPGLDTHHEVSIMGGMTRNDEVLSTSRLVEAADFMVYEVVSFDPDTGELLLRQRDDDADERWRRREDGSYESLDLTEDDGAPLEILEFSTYED